MAFGLGEIKATLGRIETQLTALTTSTITVLNSAINQGFERLVTAIDSAQTRTRGHIEATNTRIDAVNTRIDAVQSDIRALRLSVPTTADSEQIRTDIATLQALVEGWRAETAEARRAYEATLHAEEASAAPQAASTEEDVEPTDPADEDNRSPDDGYSCLLDRAAGIAYAEVTCHRDTWSFLVERAARTEHFRLPAAVEDDKDGIIEANISGRTLLAAIDALWHTRNDADAAATTRALAGRIYGRIGEALKGLRPSPDGRPSAAHIIIDDRPAKPASADESTAPGS